MTIKSGNKLKWIPSVAAALVITGSAIAKLIGIPQLVQAFTGAGILHLMRTCALAELLFIGLFLFRTSMTVGFLLLTAYYGGAIAIELANNGMPAAPICILSIIWLAACLRNPSLFGNQPISKSPDIA